MIFNCEWNMECPLNPYCPVDLIIPQILFLIITACFMCQTSPYLQVCLSFKSYLRILSIKRSVYYHYYHHSDPSSIKFNCNVKSVSISKRCQTVWYTMSCVLWRWTEVKEENWRIFLLSAPSQKKPGFVKFSFPACMIVPNVNTCFLLWISSILKV